MGRYSARRDFGRYSREDKEALAAINARIANPPKLPKPPRLAERTVSDSALALRRDMREGALAPRQKLWDGHSGRATKGAK